MQAFWELAENYRLIHQPKSNNGNKIVEAVPAKTVSESIKQFEETGGKISELEKLTNEGLHEFSKRTGQQLEEVTSTTLRRGLGLSHEGYFKMWLDMKLILDDADFCYVELSADGIEKKLDHHHAFWEAGPNEMWRLGGIEIPPWGVDDKGEPIKGNSIRSIKSGLATLKRIAKQECASPEKAEEKFFEIINPFVEPRFRIGPDFLENEDNWVSYTFSQLMYEGLRIVSGRPDFLTIAGQENISKGIRIMSRFWPVQTGYEKMSSFASHYTRAFRYETATVGTNHAVIRQIPIPERENAMGRYVQRFTNNSREQSRNTMGTVAPNVYGLSNPRILDTACTVNTISADVLSLVPKNMDQQVYKEMSRRLLSGEDHNYCEFVYTWTSALTGWKKIVKPLPILAAASTAPIEYAILTADMPIEIKILGGLLGLSPIALGALSHKLSQAKTHAEETDQQLTETKALLEQKETEWQASELEIRHNLEDRILGNAASLMKAGLYEEARKEFKNYLRHSVEENAILGYSIATFRHAGDQLPDMHGANIKIVPKGEDARSLPGLEGIQYVKSCSSFEDATHAKKVSDILSPYGAVEIPLAFTDESGQEGYIVVDEIHEEGRPGVRAPNILELHEHADFDTPALKETLKLAARIYAELWKSSIEDPALLSPTKDTLEETVTKCVGLPGSDEPYTQGICIYTTDTKAITRFREEFIRYAPVLFKHINSLNEGASFDFSPRNIVCASKQKQVLVDLDRVDKLDFASSFARFVEMSDVVDEEKIPEHYDETSKHFSTEGQQTPKNRLFITFLDLLYENADDRLRSKLETDAEELIKYFPSARAHKAFRHVGSWGHWSKKYENQDDQTSAMNSKRHGLKTLENIPRALEEATKVDISEDDKKQIAKLKQAYTRLIRHIKVAGAPSDLHVHGAVSHCVLKRYPEKNVFDATNIDEKLHAVEDILESKLTSAKGLLDHIGIVEHPQFIDYGIPFFEYRKVLDTVRKRHESDFISIQTGIELECMIDEAKRLRVDFELLNETGNPDLQDLNLSGDQQSKLSTPEEILRSLDVYIIGIHRTMFTRNGKSHIANRKEYAQCLSDAASELEKLKETYGEEKIYIIAHPFKYLCERRDADATDMQMMPDAGDLLPFFRKVYESDIVIELNLAEAFPPNENMTQIEMTRNLVHMLAQHYITRNQESGAEKTLTVSVTRDTHHHSELSMNIMPSAKEYLQVRDNMPIEVLETVLRTI